MTYVKRINEELVLPKSFRFEALDLFAGCGGLSLGFEASGIRTTGYEMESDYAETYRHNLAGDCICKRLQAGEQYPVAQIVIGGPPCQPFSVGGKQLGLKDSRDGFPVFIEAIEQVDPDIWLFENVRGLLFRNKHYFDEIIARLKVLNYIVEYKLINAVSFGIPQNRERLVIVGHRGEFKFPIEVDSKVTVGEALGSLATSIPDGAKFLTPSMDKYVAKYEKASKCVNPRDLHLDRPARTLTCRNLAGATGDMQRIRLADGRRRRITVREAARLQSFPDWFHFSGSETSQYYQVGNAVPPAFAKALATSVVSYLESRRRYASSEILYRNLPRQSELFVMESGNGEYAMLDFLPKSKKLPSVKKVINEALNILNSLGIPFDGMTERRLERMGMAFLAVVDVKRSKDWPDAKQSGDGWAPQTRQLIDYINKHFGESISSGSYDDIRRKDLKLTTVAGIIERSANNPNGQSLQFSPGEHNDLQKSIIEEFLPRYGFASQVLYVGDTANKFLLYDKVKLEQMSFFELTHNELPDVLAYSESKNWLFLIEAVHSSGPINSVRLEELKRLTAECSAEIVFVTAFLDRAMFRKFAPGIAWETEVWIAESPDHMIHFNGDKFLGPYNK